MNRPGEGAPAGGGARDCPTRAGLALDLLEGGGRHSAHRRRCPTCAREWRALRRLESRLEESIADVPEPGQGCPGAAEWAALADGATRGRRRADLVEHLVECDACAALWSFLCRLPVTEDRADVEGPRTVHESRVAEIGVRSAVEERSRSSGAGGPAPDPGGRGAAAARWGLRLAAVLTAGGILAWLALPPPPVSPGGQERLRGAAAELVVEAIQERPGTDPRLRWRGGPPVDSYRLRLWNGEGELLAERSLPATTQEWSGEFPDVEVLYWQVEGWRDGVVVARGPLRRLETTVPPGRAGR